MDFLTAFLIFIGAMVFSVVMDVNMMMPLFVGFFAFGTVAYRRGQSVRDILRLSAAGIKKAIVVVQIMLCIGFLTASWRSGGTILFFVYYGVGFITPHIFILAAFLLCLILSYMLGTSFGTAGTMGVIIMTIAKASGVDPLMTAGAIMSGIYFGDRGSPASSSASLTALITDTELYGNVKMMYKTGLAALLLSIGFYGVLSYLNPMPSGNIEVLNLIAESYDISWYVAIPAVIMLVLPLLKVKVYIAMLISAAAATVEAVLFQGVPAGRAVWSLIAGVASDGTYLGDLLSGGGLVSMLDICVVVMLSCTYSEMFEATDMLRSVNERMAAVVGKIGRFPTACILSVLTCAIFCNQTIAAIVTVNLLSSTYKNSGASNEEMAMDIENSAIVIAGVVPWCLACIAPLTMIGSSLAALKYSVYMFLIPITYGLTKKLFFKKQNL